MRSLVVMVHLCYLLEMLHLLLILTNSAYQAELIELPETGKPKKEIAYYQ